MASSAPHKRQPPADQAQPPAGLSSALAALWWDRKGNWDKAHETAQAGGGRDGAWVHAYLHRKEGDLGNAGYWYRRAGKSAPSGSLGAEWEAIARALCSDYEQLNLTRHHPMTSIPANDNSPDETAIRNLIENWARAVRERNLPGILADHAPDILMFDVPPPFLSKGIKAYEETWDTFFAGSNYAGVFDIDHLEVTAGGEVAFATALMHCGTPDENGPNGQLQFRLTVGLRKIAGRWAVLHEHHSIPAV